MRSVKEFAYAKINLFLTVTEKREDGFHGIETVMHTVSLSDSVTLTVTSQSHRGVRLIIDGNKRLPYDSKNIAYTAAMLFLERLGINNEITIKLVKRIPMSAGLAGGSADAAAVLRGMNRLYGKPMTDKLLLRLAAELGSDVPFCLIGGTALCRGRGEIMTRLSPVKLHTVVAVSDEYVSTPVAYGALDRRYSDFDGTVPLPEAAYMGTALAESINKGVLDESKLYNVFESVVLEDNPGATSIKKKLDSLGAIRAMMSGSGPSVFGIFDTEGEAREAARVLKEEGVHAFYAASV